MNKDGGPAFPDPQRLGAYGMSLRDWFAGQPVDMVSFEGAGPHQEALVGRPCPSWQDDPLGFLQWSADWEAAWRYMRADAMLAERERGKP